MKILVVVSDRAELAAFDDRFIKTVSGIGPVFAAAAAADSIIRYRPDVVVSAGSAGSAAVYGGKNSVFFRFYDCVSFHKRFRPSIPSDEAVQEVCILPLHGHSSLHV